MKYYELNYLISPNLSQEELKTFQEKIEKSIQEEGGILAEIKNPTKRNFFPSVKTKFQRTTETAYFITLKFNLVPEKLKNIEKKLKSESQVLRYLILNKKIGKEAPPALKTFSKMPDVHKPKFEKTKKEKAKLEEIEEKLEEILGDT